MAKRGGSELNHLNWDQDDPGEAAGVFQKAGASELKGRVIKKARRRNVGDEAAAPKNAFSSFSGFATAAKPSAEASFGFLADKKSEAPSFFGSDKKTESGPVFGSAKSSFALGGGGASETAKPVAPAFGGFSFGSKAEEKRDEPVKVNPLSPVNDNKSASETSQPGFSFGASDSGGKSENKGGFSFGAPATSPSSTFSTTSSGFSFGASKSDAVPPAASSGAFSFGSGDKSSSAVEKPAAGGGFSFGSTSSSTDKPASGGAFSFGAPAKTGETPAEKPASTGFAFGSSKSTESSAEKPASSMFSFGAKATTTTTVESIPKAAESFAFGAKQTESPKKSTEPPPAAFGGFAFGSKSVPEKKESPKKQTETNGKDIAKEIAKKSADEGNKEIYSDEYLAHLKALNLQVTDWIKRHVTENPLVLLSPVFQDYEKHLAELSVKYPVQKTSSSISPVSNQTNSISAATAKPASTGFSTDTPKPFAPGSSSVEKKSDSSAAPFSFGSSAAGSESTAKPFAFGSSSSETKPASSAPGGGFSFGSNLSQPGGGFAFGASATGGASMFANVKPPAAVEPSKGEEDEDDQPPKVEVKVVEESDALYSKKCKLFYKKDGNYCEKGVGMLHLKKADSGKTQLLVRADTNLGNILLNIMLNADIPTTRVGKNNVMLVCVPNPPIDPKATTSEPTPMLIRVKSGDDADALKEKLDELKKK